MVKLSEKVLIFALTVFSFGWLNLQTLYAEKSFEDENPTITVAASREEMVDGFKSIGISDDTANQLAQKVISGELIDSRNPVYDNIAPSVEIKSDYLYYAEYTYPDGSKKIVSVNMNRGAGISGGTTVTGDVYYQVSGATVYGSYGDVSMSFTASYRSATTSANIISITNVSAGSVYYNPKVAYGTTTNTVACGGAQYTIGSGTSSGAYYLQLNVPAALGSAYAGMMYQGPNIH